MQLLNLESEELLRVMISYVISLLLVVQSFNCISVVWSWWVEFRSHKIKLQKKELAERGKFLSLTREDMEMLPGSSQATATVFEIEDKKEGHVPLEWLQERLQKIVFQNPWLLAKLCSGKRPEDPPTFWVPNEPTRGSSEEDIDISQHFSVIEVPNISNALKDCSEYTCKSGVACVDQNEPLWKFTVLKSQQSKKFAIVMSICHTLGDGSTFYKILGMLNGSDAGIFPMQIERVFPSDLDPEAELRLQSLYADVKCGTMPGFLKRNWNYIRRRTYAIKTEFRIVDTNKMKKMKESVQVPLKLSKEQPSFISTNDILVASLLPKPTLGLVPMDLRGKLNGITEQLAGNYIILTSLLPKEHSTPLDVRSFISKFRHKLTCPIVQIEKPPEKKSLLDEVDVDGISVSTNWTSFYREINLVGCKTIIHFPVHELFKFPATTIFKPSPSLTAVRIDSPEDNHSFLGEELLPFNF